MEENHTQNGSTEFNKNTIQHENNYILFDL